jgi:N-methylhydantoinase B
MAEMKKVDSITLAVVEGALFATVREMRVTLIRTSYAPILYETHDFSCCLLSRRGEIMALSLDDVPLHTFPMAVQMKTVFEKFGDEIYPGDVIMMNDPFTGGTHLNDVAIVVPFFFENSLVLFIGIRAHWGDVGGATPGSFSGRDTEIYQEGIRIPPVKIYDKGKPNQSFLDVLFANVRFVQDRKGDFLAMLDTSRTAERRLSEICEKYGVMTVLECLDTLLDTTEERMRTAISKLPDGEYFMSSRDPILNLTSTQLGVSLCAQWCFHGAKEFIRP